MLQVGYWGSNGAEMSAILRQLARSPASLTSALPCPSFSDYRLQSYSSPGQEGSRKALLISRPGGE